MKTSTLISSPLYGFLLFQLATLGTSQNSLDTDLFEGDILPDYVSISSAYDETTVKNLVEKGYIEEPMRRGTSPTFALWNMKMNKKDVYVIKAYINPDKYEADDIKTIKKALRQLQKKTGVMKFKFPSEKPSGVAYLNYGVYTGGRCASYVGRTSYAKAADGQPIFLDPACLSTGTIQHETMHALGFWHEQSRPDRDDYVTIIMENVQEGYEMNFDKQNDKIDSLGAPYDYDSVMHYHSRAFGYGAVTTIDSHGHSIGQRIGISSGDKIQLRLLYQCSPAIGPRNYTAYMSETCTADCKCGKGWKGCRVDGRDDSTLCKGSFECRNDKCVKAIKTV